MIIIKVSACKRLLTILTWVASLFEINLAANVLFLGSMPSPSHHIWNKQLYYGLSERGHNVTVFSADNDTFVTKNLHYIVATDVYKKLYSETDEFDLEKIINTSTIDTVTSLWSFCTAATQFLLESDGFDVLKSYPENFKFDLIVIDYTCGPPLLGIIEQFKHTSVVVGVTAYGSPHFTYAYIGGHKKPGYIPHHSMGFSNDMNLLERLLNHFYIFIEDIYYNYVYLPTTYKFVQKALNRKNVTDLQILGKKIALALVNTHFSIEATEPVPSNVIPIAGVHITDPKKLNIELEKFIEDSAKGTVLFSLGTNIQSTMMKKTIISTFLDVFQDFPEYNFLWKFETNMTYLLTKNVKIQSWLKQNDILAHPNIKAFISHCGLLGTQEAIWYGKPVIGIPFYSDQFRNIAELERKGMGYKLNYNEISHSTIKNALKKVLEDPKYLINSKKQSILFKDQLDKPLNRAIFWLEWVMRHKDDLEKIQSPVKKVGNFIADSNDVICLMILTFVCTSWLFRLCLKHIYRTLEPQRDKLKSN